MEDDLDVGKCKVEVGSCDALSSPIYYIVMEQLDVACSTEVLPADEFFKNLFPDRYETKIVWQHVNEQGGTGGSCQARIALSTKEEFVQWLAEHQAKSGVIYRVRRTRTRDGKYCLYKADYRCQHNTLAHLNKSKQPAKKHTLCPAYLSVTIKAFPKKSRSKDPYLPRYPAIVKIHYVHNHPVYASASVSQPIDVSIQTDVEPEADSSPSAAPQPQLVGSADENNSSKMDSNDKYWPDTPAFECVDLYENCSTEHREEDQELLSNSSEVEYSRYEEPFEEDQAYHLKVLEYMFGDMLDRVRQSYDNNPAGFDRAIEMACDAYQELNTDDSLLNALNSFGRFSEHDSTLFSICDRKGVSKRKESSAKSTGLPEHCYAKNDNKRLMAVLPDENTLVYEVNV